MITREQIALILEKISKNKDGFMVSIKAPKEELLELCQLAMMSCEQREEEKSDI